MMRVYMGVEPMKEGVPIQPTAHYAMGGIPTNVNAGVVINEKNKVLPGMYAAGEVRVRVRPRRESPGDEQAG